MFLEFEIKDKDDMVLKGVIQDKSIHFIDLSKNMLSVRITNAEFKFKEPEQALNVFKGFVAALEGYAVQIEGIGYIRAIIFFDQAHTLKL